MILYNRTTSVADTHRASIGHSKTSKTIAEAVGAADIIWSCLQNENAVEAVLEEILAVDITGKLFVESSTLTPETINRVAERICTAGGELVALPGMFGLSIS